MHTPHEPTGRRIPAARWAAVLALLAVGGTAAACARPLREPDLRPPPGSVWDSQGGKSEGYAHELNRQTPEQQLAKSEGCLSCHEGLDRGEQKMHASQTIRLGCVDCHGGDPTSREK